MPANYKRKHEDQQAVARKAKRGRLGTLNGIPYAITQRSTTRVFTYYENLALNTQAGGAASVNVYRANSMYDPNLTGTGGQPRGYDQWLGASGGDALYNQYVVTGAKITATFINTDNTDFQQVGIALVSTATAGLAGIDYLELPPARNKSAFLDLAGSGQGIKKLTSKFSAKTFFGVKDVKDVAGLGADYQNNPTQQAYWHVWVDNPSGADAGPTRVQIRIDYIAELRKAVQPFDS